MRVIAYLFIGEDSQTRATAFTVDEDSFDSIVLFQACVATVLIF
jgi:hypothetical protein